MKPLFQQSTTPTGFVEVTATHAQQSLPVAGIPAGQSLVIVSDADIDKIGTRITGNASKTAQQILANVKASDVDGFGNKLNELIAVSKQLDPKKMSNKGIINKVTSFFGATKEKLVAQYETVEKRMNTLVAEMDKSVQLQSQRIGDLEQMYNDNESAFYGYGEEIERCKAMIEQIKAQLTTIENASADMFASQRQNDLLERIRRLEKKSDDFLRSQQLCKLAAPEIRVMQANARALVSTFHDIKETTIPAWQGVFSRYVLSMEQKRAAELATSVMDATNEAFRMQADQLRANVNAIATTRERSVVDIDTLEHMQNQLMGALTDARRIAEEGARARSEARAKLANMDQQLIQLNVSTTTV